MPSEDFPIFGEEDQQVQFSISSKNLKSLISHTAFAVSTKDVTQPIYGLGLSVDDGVFYPILIPTQPSN